MDILLTIIAVIVIFSLLVLIHEYGHFIVARRAGIRVMEFGVGFPPRLWKKKIGETVYSVNAIPFGGFVKLHGEDAVSTAVLKDKRSYAHQSPWVRTKVVVAGVCMNFLLAILLLTIGFTVGIEPLLVTERDLFHHIEAENVKIAPGVFVSKVHTSATSLGISPGDQIIAVNDRLVTDPAHIAMFAKEAAERDVDVTLRVSSGAEKKLHLPVMGKKSLGIQLKPFFTLPRIFVFEVKPGSQSEKAGIRSGDAILQMNGEQIYSASDFETIMAEAARVDFTLLREGKIVTVTVDLPDARRVVIAEVFENSAAAKAGFRASDILHSIDGVPIHSAEQVILILKKNPGKEMLYSLIRGGSMLQIVARSGEKNQLGVALSSLLSFHNTELSVYQGSVLTSLTEVKKVRYTPFRALKQAIGESVRLTGITVSAFGRAIRSIIAQFTVPSEIGGPVQIVYYTRTFIQEGFFALLRFTALLSLSLAVLNVLPIPALDGGRLLFIIIEVLFKKRVSARFESMVHSIGFVLLFILIILVTYSDIVKLF